MKHTGLFAALMAVALVAGSVFLLLAANAVNNAFCKQVVMLCCVASMYTAAVIVVKADVSSEAEQPHHSQKEHL